MRKETKLFLLLVMFLSMPVYYFAQSHELAIPSGSYVEDYVKADVNTDGTRVDADRWYVLERDGIYFCQSYIENKGYTLRIKAADGSGEIPVVYLLRNPTTNTTPGRFIRVSGNVELENIAVCGYLEPDVSTMGDMVGGLLQTNSPGFNITIDGCILNNSSGNHIRTDSYASVIKVTNTIFGNMGYLGTSNFGAGKAVDLRAGQCDTLIIQNCTFVNGQDRIIRHYGSTSPIKYFKFDHNTVINWMGYHGVFSLGKVGDEVVMTNNMLFDPFAFGDDQDSVRQTEFTDTGELDAYGKPKMAWILTEPNDTTQWTVSNNFYSISEDCQAFYTKYQSAGLVGEGSPFTDHQKERLGAEAAAAAFYKESNTVTKAPALMLELLEWYRNPSGGNKTKVTTNWSLAYDYKRTDWVYLADTLDATYDQSTKAYYGAENGYPAGDLNWYPTLKTQWEDGIVIGVEEEGTVPAEYSLEQNYPNPFNPTTQISYTLPKASIVSLTVFNTLGQEVAKLVNSQEQAAGKYNVTWNGRNDFNRTLSSGIYFYQIKTNDFTNTKKMMFIK